MPHPQGNAALRAEAVKAARSLGIIYSGLGGFLLAVGLYLGLPLALGMVIPGVAAVTIGIGLLRLDRKP